MSNHNLFSSSDANPNRERPLSKSKHVCTLCNKHFPWKSGLSRHIKLFHLQNQSKSYECEMCGKLFHKRVGLSIHLKQHSRFKLNLLKSQGAKKPLSSSTIVTNKTQKISHLYANIVSETIYSSDSDCEYEILQTATKLGNSDTRSDHKCHICNKAFVKLNSLQRHIKKHINAVEVLNSDNDGTSDNADLDNSDCETQEGAQSFNCSECAKTFKQACNLTNHLKIHLKQSVVARKELSENTLTKMKTRYPCSLCNKIYLSKVHLDNHISTHTNSRSRDLDKLSCPDCDKTFTKEALEIHKQTHVLSKPFLCMVCGKGYSRSGYLSIHMRIHSNYRPHLCSVCGKSFTIRRYLIIHSRIHNQERPYKCQHCDKGFIQKGNLIEHLRIHSGVKPHNCAICEKRFTHYSGLTQHLLTHNPVKRHICKICGKAFRLGGHYREHIRIHSGDRPYVCNICDRGFASSSSLVVHLRTHSGERPFKCSVCKKGFIKSYGLKQHKKTHSTCNIMENIT